jgi:hypothetical protein
MNKITTDEGYDKALQWLVKRAETIANPLLSPEQKAAERAKYDEVERECLKYRMPHLFTELEQPKEEPKKPTLDDFF